MRGKVQIETVSSRLLKGNPLGDPHLREVPVYLPPSYGSSRGRRYPVVYYLTGYSGTAVGVLNRRLWKENVVQRLDRLIEEGKARECVLVIPDCLTLYGGSQYIDSAATGPYMEHIVKELVPFFEDKHALLRGAAGRAVMGQSSGGYGSLMLGMRHPEVFGHVACHSGDLLWETSYALEFPKAVNTLYKYGQSAARFLREFRASKRRDLFHFETVMILAMSSCYSPNPKSPMGFDLPFDERTGELIPAVWKRWKALDPVEAVKSRGKALKSLKTLYFDCGRRDEFFLHLGARKLSDVLKKMGVKHLYEEHELGHMDMAERFDRSLVLLSSRLSS